MGPRAARLVEVHLDGIVDVELGEGVEGVVCGRAGGCVGDGGPNGERGGDGGVVLGGEVAYDVYFIFSSANDRGLTTGMGDGTERTHERRLEIRALVRRRRAEEPTDVLPVRRGDDGVLVLVRLARRVGEGLRHPVRGADEGRLGVDVGGALLLAGGDDGDVVGVGAREAVGRELRGVRVGRGVGRGVVEEDFGEVGGLEEGEGELQPVDEVVFGGDVLGDEGGAFVGVVLEVES